jgi:hypothetical protein
MHLLLAASLIAIAPMSKGAHAQAAAMGSKLERRLLEHRSVTVRRLDVNAVAQSLDENWEVRVRNAVTAIAAEPAPRSLVLFVENDSASLRDMLVRAAEPVGVVVYPVVVRDAASLELQAGSAAQDGYSGTTVYTMDMPPDPRGFAITWRGMKKLAEATGGRVTAKADSLRKAILGIED